MRWIACVLLPVLAATCGQKGPLTLPEEESSRPPARHAAGLAGGVPPALVVDVGRQGVAEAVLLVLLRVDEEAVPVYEPCQEIADGDENGLRFYADTIATAQPIRIPRAFSRS